MTFKKKIYDLYFWHDDACRDLRASLFEERNFMLAIRLGYASTRGRVAGHTHWEIFFGAAAFLFLLDRLCFF